MARLADVLRESFSHLKYVSTGKQTLDQFLSITSTPDRDIPRSGTGTTPLSVNKSITDKLDQIAKDLGYDSNTGCFIYNRMSSMGWHTNSDSVGERMYITFTMGDSVFRYKDPDTGEIVDDYDEKGGWTIRQFTIPKGKPLWHTIWSEKPRFSFGFKRAIQ